ncbi:hypothetical protein JI721_02315 [Alicyclobacillus cycloheptanicus]|uniref:Ribosomally synthesized peptide with SipW-like signal peptide n=1 Tax=Alicyclobacillus cycloheptanicus TaxID=1457 RepID=A0ABT9XGJ0_9BACL|nr:TasA family protein [Alicyclobacillus cycloheptanicus]MDQ0188943.1 putative ribosomally synthesized peptide with SipW-like signal peptide [Alicyclobacillus cycloheptanicus]WDM01708.1 hypothetical protein JI721_02315 [Alicyclobacillus cycloheptanicus]
MGLKTKVAMAMGTSAAGAAMVIGGTFALFTASASTTSDAFTAGTLKLNTSGQFFAGALNVNNLAPGDSIQGTFNITNTGSLTEWVGLEDTPVNVVNGHSYAANDAQHLGLFSSFNKSVDASAGTAGYADPGQNDPGSGNESIGWTFSPWPGHPTLDQSGDYTQDLHPATYSYMVTSNGQTLVAATTPSSTTDVNQQGQPANAFLLQPNQTATVTYTVTLPLAAHNDYQGLSGAVNVEVDAVQARNNWVTANSTADQTGDPNASAAGPWSWQPDVNN